MVCEPEAQADISRALGVTWRRAAAPTWVNQLYTCEFVDGSAAVTLTVKQLAGSGATKSYFSSLSKQYGRRTDVQGIGDAAFLAADDSMVVRKDAKVLRVDVSQVPATFGVPAEPHREVAVLISEAIMACWKGG
jgi:hypothetical protein